MLLVSGYRELRNRTLNEKAQFADRKALDLFKTLATWNLDKLDGSFSREPPFLSINHTTAPPRKMFLLIAETSHNACNSSKCAIGVLDIHRLQP